jgi:hypothetical protein
MILRIKRGRFVRVGAVMTFIPRIPWRDRPLARFNAAIPRYQRILFYVLLAGIVLMAIFLIHERRVAHDRLTAHNDATPLAAPVSNATEAFTFDLASDSDGSVTATQREIALPVEPSVRARALLERLVAEYALPSSSHPLASGAAVDDVFLLKLPVIVPQPVGTASTESAPAPETADSDTSRDEELAVVSLRGSFVNDHPSGVEVEMLTLLSMIGTLHANFPRITQVRFLVDGQPRETLAGHADLGRVYPVIDTTMAAGGSAQ